MVLNKIKKYGEVVMFSHSLFSLPFAGVALLMAAGGIPEGETIFWILVALLAGRNGANAINRVIDAEIDKKNPRTSNRHIPQGDVKKIEVILLTMILFIIFIFAAYKLNSLCFYLSPVAIGLFLVYSYTKRFTWLCHLVLGVACAGAPVGAWLAVTGEFVLTPFILGAAVAVWIGGFDIIYATQDIEFDRANGLFSIPARFGEKTAMNIVKVAHGCAFVFLLSIYFIEGLGIIYLAGLVIIGFLLMLEHRIVDSKNEVIMKVASYNLNQIISVSYFTFFVLDMIII